MMILGLLWIVLLSIDMVRGLQGRLAIFSEIIWIIFGIDFALELLIAPNKWRYVKRHWPVAASLAVPALRVVRFARVVHFARAGGTLRFGQALAAVNRSLAALGSTLRARDDFPQAVADAVVTIAAADRAGYVLAVEDILESFEQRTDFLEDVPVADTVLVLQVLAAARDVAADLPPSPLLPK